MKQQSRSYNVARNAAFSLICQSVSLILSFVSRSVFIATLGNNYLGVNGLFSNILTVLSFAELGIGTAIVYSMYKPLAGDDTEKLKSLMAWYRKAYRIIGIIVAVAGITVIPFMGLIIRDAPNIPDNLTFIYLLYLANSVASYFFVYKKSIINADQKNYVVVTYYQVTHILQVILQTIILFVTRNFILYLLIQIICTVANNVLTAHKADRMYPYLKEQAEPLSAAERGEIAKNVRALVLYKIGGVALNGTDNIILSAMFGVASVGLYSNYVLFMAACSMILGKITEAFTASVGNLNTTSTPDKQYSVFTKIFFITAWLFGFASVGLMLMLNDVIDIWIGSDYLFSSITVFSIVLHFYINSVSFAAHTYRTTLGLFIQGRFAPAIAAVVNIILSVVLGKLWGVSGVFFATSIARFFTMGLVDPILIYKRTFKRNPAKYYTMYFSYAGFFAGLYFVLRWLLAFNPVTGLLGILIECGIITIVFNGVMVAVFSRTQMFRELCGTVKSLIRRKTK